LAAVNHISQLMSMDVFLVGGMVRDLMLGTFSGRDFDLALRGDPRLFGENLAREVKGTVFALDEAFGQYRVVQSGKDGTISIDISVLKGDSIEDDLKRRDFTINSLAVKVKDLLEREDPEIVDPLGGLRDLAEMRIRLSSSHALKDDPVRMMRAVRIERSHSFTLDREVRELTREDKNLILTTAPERIRDELFRILDLPGVYESLILLHELELLDLLLPELVPFHGLGQGERHRFDLWEHSLNTARLIEVVLSEMSMLCPDHSAYLAEHFNALIEGEVKRSALLQLTSLLHDSGKPVTMTCDAGRIRFLGHDKEGGRINRELAMRLRLGKKASRYMQIVTENHMRVLNLLIARTVTQRAKYRFFHDLEEMGMDVLVLSLADAQATDGAVTTQGDKGVRSLVSCFIEYYFNEYKRASPKPLISGSDIMSLFHIPEGKKVGELLDLLREAETQGEITTKEEAIALLSGRVE
jgi:poly(A) polymerase